MNETAQYLTSIPIEREALRNVPCRVSKANKFFEHIPLGYVKSAADGKVIVALPYRTGRKLCTEEIDTTDRNIQFDLLTNLPYADDASAPLHRILFYFDTNATTTDTFVERTVEDGILEIVNAEDSDANSIDNNASNIDDAPQPDVDILQNWHASNLQTYVSGYTQEDNKGYVFDFLSSNVSIFAFPFTRRNTHDTPAKTVPKTDVIRFNTFCSKYWKLGEITA